MQCKTSLVGYKVFSIEMKRFEQEHTLVKVQLQSGLYEHSPMLGQDLIAV